ncbi:MAG: hypothetical protein KJ638_04725 [Chloroflexi bacterium]|nr:hypothetical protein [Chloroflexota bacterium]
MANSDFSAIAEVVPQVSYEIVGRIIPGIVVILSLVVVAMGPTQAVMYLDEAVIHPDPALSGWAVVLMVIAAYILVFALDGVWQIPACVRRRGEKPCQPDLQAPSTSLKFEVVNQKLPKAGAWLTKLYAETNAAQVLIIGWVVSAAINIYCLVTAFSVERLWLEVGLIAGTIGAVAVRNSITTTRKESLENLWVLLQERTFAEQAENTAGEGRRG